MPEVRWIDRDKDGKITGDYARKQREGQESIAADAPELLARNAELKAEMETAAKAQTDLTAEVANLKTVKQDKAAADEKALSIEARLLALEADVKGLKEVKPK